MKVAIHQPNYLPWCGYFAKLAACDVFIFLDDAQISKASYVPRTKIRASEGQRWLTIPTGRHHSPLISNVEMAHEKWAKKHQSILRQAYLRSPHLEEVMALLEPIYADPGTNLAILNQRIVKAVAGYLGIDRPMLFSSSLDVHRTRDERHIELIRKVGGTHYLSGKGGANYQDPGKFKAAGIELEVCEYSPIPYEAPRYPFMPGLSIVDALFIKGKAARELLRYAP